MTEGHQFSPGLSLHQKRLQFLVATMDLGIDSKSFSRFLRDAVEIEEQHLAVVNSILSQSEIQLKKRAIMQADLVRLILDYF